MESKMVFCDFKSASNFLCALLNFCLECGQLCHRVTSSTVRSAVNIVEYSE